MIKRAINSAIAFVFYSFLVMGQALAADASLLPNGKQQFFDNNGNPLTAGKVYFYIPNTTTNKTTWQDAAKTIPNANPVILDAAGRATIYGDGTYRQILRTSNNTLIWDVVTNSYQPAGAPVAATGDGDLVGTIKPWAGLSAPNQYEFAYGQEKSRNDFSALYTAITQQATINCTSGSPILTGFTDTGTIKVGAIIESTCAPIGSLVSSKTASSVTLNGNAVISTTDTIRIFNYGNGNGTTTFTLPDLRGYVLAGRTNMGGTASSNLTSTYCGTNPQAQGANCGTESKTILTANLPAYTPTGTISNTTATGTLSGVIALSLSDPGHTHTVNNGDSQLRNTSGASGFDAGGNIGGATITNNTATTGITGTVNIASGTFTGAAHNHTFTGVAQGGTSTAFSIVQPTQTINYIIKVTPDSNSAEASGVTSLGGMTGDIACGTNLICTGNTISVTGSAAGGSTTQVQFNNGGALAGSPLMTWISPVLTLGATGSASGQLALTGSTSGTLIQTVAVVAGTPTVTWGTSSGTPAVTASSPLAIASGTGNITCSTCLTSSGGGALAASAPLNLSGNTLSISGAAGQVLAGATPAFTSTPTLGASGTLGTITFGNATSGTITLSPVTGALGTVTVSIPAATDTLVGKATTDTFTNKTFNTAGTGNTFQINGTGITAVTGTGAVVLAASPSFSGTIAGTFTIGTNATWNGQVITSAYLPTATNAALGLAQCDGVTITCSSGIITSVGSAASDIAVGTTTVSSGTSAYLLYNNAGVLGNRTIASVLTAGSGIAITGTTNATIALTAARLTLPTRQTFTSGSGTYTTPANTLWIRIRLFGGGGGGGGTGTASSGTGGTGGNTCWNTSGAACTTPVYQAGGGPGGSGTNGASSTGPGAASTVSGSASCTASFGGAQGGVQNNAVNSSPGGIGGSSFAGGAGAGGSPGVVGSNAVANTGGGGGGAGGFGSSGSAAGGSAGAYCEVIINSPAATYTYAVGASGTAGAAGTSGFAGGAGAAGYIVVEEHYGS